MTGEGTQSMAAGLERANEPKGMAHGAGTLTAQAERAYWNRDLEALQRVMRIAEARAPQSSACLRGLDRHELERRRNDLHVSLAAINDALRLIGATASADQQRQRAAWLATNPDSSLDPSEHPFG